MMVILVAVVAVLVTFVFVAWACYDAGYNDGWIDHSEGKVDHRYFYGWRKS